MCVIHSQSIKTFSEQLTKQPISERPATTPEFKFAASEPLPMADPPAPELPAEQLDGWTQVEAETETLFRTPGVRVDGRTVVYEDSEEPSRFVFASALQFVPPLVPGTAPFVMPTVIEQAREAFADRLRDRGATTVEYGSSSRVEVDAGTRATLIPYRARFPDHPEAVEGRLAIWHSGAFRIAGGAYPASEPETERYREELLTLLRAVE